MITDILFDEAGFVIELVPDVGTTVEAIGFGEDLFLHLTKWTRVSFG